jgi:hypothetical protein
MSPSPASKHRLRPALLAAGLVAFFLAQYVAISNDSWPELSPGPDTDVPNATALFPISYHSLPPFVWRLQTAFSAPLRPVIVATMRGRTSFPNSLVGRWLSAHAGSLGRIRMWHFEIAALNTIAWSLVALMAALCARGFTRIKHAAA